MSIFILIAGMMTLVVLAAVILPLVKKNADVAAPRPAVWAALGASVVLIAAAALYPAWSNWSWQPAASGDTPERMVSRLARRLEKNPNDLEGWLKLGRSYAVLEQYPLSARAYQNANRLAEGKSAQALVGLGEAMISSDGRMPEGRAGQLFEQALKLEPSHPKALWYAGMVAYQAGNLRAARERWAALVALNPPPRIKQLLEAKVADLDRQLREHPP